MRAMILAAGRGLRMGELTATTPKPLLTIKGIPLIEYHIQALKKAGINEIVINLGYLGNQIEEYLQDRKLGVDIFYSRENPILETGGGVKNALALLGKKFIVVSADLYTDYDFAKLLVQKAPLYLVMVNNPSYHSRGDYGLNGDNITLNAPYYTFANIGLYNQELFQEITETIFPLHLIFEATIKQGLAQGELFSGMWHNVGTKVQLEELNK